MKKTALIMSFTLLFLAFPSLLWGALFEFKYGFKTGGMVKVKMEKSLVLKASLQAHKAFEEGLIQQVEKINYTDHLKEVKDKKVMKSTRKYNSYIRVTQAFQEEQSIKESHPLAGSKWKLERKGQRTTTTLLQGKGISKPASKAVRMDNAMNTLARYLPQRKVSPGYTWNLSYKATQEILGDNWKRGSRATVRCKFVRKVFHKGFQCAKIHISIRTRGNHKFGVNAESNMSGYLYYSLRYGFAISMSLKGKMKLTTTQVAPRGQKVTFKAEGPVRWMYYQQYRPPETTEDDEDQEDN